MRFEIPVEHPVEVFKMLFGKEWDLMNGSLKVGVAKNLRMEDGRIVGEADIPDIVLFENYGSKATVGGFHAKVHQ